MLKLNAKETWEDLVKILPTEGTKLRMQDFNFYAVPDEEDMEKLEVIMTDEFYPELMETQPTRLACEWALGAIELLSRVPKAIRLQEQVDTIKRTRSVSHISVEPQVDSVPQSAKVGGTS